MTNTSWPLRGTTLFIPGTRTWDACVLLVSFTLVSSQGGCVIPDDVCLSSSFVEFFCCNTGETIHMDVYKLLFWPIIDL